MVKYISEKVDETDGLEARTEFRVETPGGFKSVRFVDVAAVDENDVPVKFWQVGRQTSSGFPVMRESEAIWDITGFTSEFGEVPLEFVAYNGDSFDFGGPDVAPGEE